MKSVIKIKLSCLGVLIFLMPLGSHKLETSDENQVLHCRVHKTHLVKPLLM